MHVMRRPPLRAGWRRDGRAPRATARKQRTAQKPAARTSLFLPSFAFAFSSRACMASIFEIGFLMAPPVVYNDSLLWGGSTGQVYSLPQFRIGGIYAPANGEFSTQAFRIPSTPLWVNVVAQWFGGLPSHHGGGGCDEGCNAYFFCAVLDAESGEALREGRREQLCTPVGPRSVKT